MTPGGNKISDGAFGDVLPLFRKAKNSSRISQRFNFRDKSADLAGHAGHGTFERRFAVDSCSV